MVCRGQAGFGTRDAPALGIKEFVNETWLVNELLPLHRLGWRGWSSPAHPRSCQIWEMALEILSVLVNAALCKIKIFGIGDFWNFFNKLSLHCCFCAHKIIFISFLVTNHQPSSPLAVPAHWACLSASCPSFSSPLPLCFQGFPQLFQPPARVFPSFPSLYFTRVWVALLCPCGLQPQFPSPWGDLPSLLWPPGFLPGCPGLEAAPWLWLEFGFLPCWTVHCLGWIWGDAKTQELCHIKQFLSSCLPAG